MRRYTLAMPLDPQAAAYLAKTPPRPGTPAERREATRAQRVVHVSDIEIPGPDGVIGLRVYAPPGEQPLPVFLYFHGGGWVTGDLDVNDSLCRIIAEWAGCIVVSANYRHAPEHVYPAAFDDAYAAASWVHANAESLGGDPARLAIGGASAGGNLAAAVTLKARAEQTPPFVYQWLIYPVTDATMSAPSYAENEEGFGLSRAAMQWYWDQYVPDVGRRTEPFASPMAAGDFHGLPPALVLTAEFDPLRDEGEAYARALEGAGVAVVLKRYDGMIHGFLSSHGEFDQAKRCLIESTALLRAALISA